MTPGSNIKGSTEKSNFFLFIAVNTFYSINKNTGAFIDFSPQDYPNPLDILQRLQA